MYRNGSNEAFLVLIEEHVFIEQHSVVYTVRVDSGKNRYC